MSREIKFRAWNKFTNTMIPTKKVEFSFSEWINNDNWVFMQFTGLKDKNDKEIYEGDIVRTIGKKWKKNEDDFGGNYEDVEHISVVEWWKSYSNIGYRLKSKFGKTVMIKPSALVTMKVEVIGNIHENPELLKTIT